MKLRGDVERQHLNKGRESYSTINDSDFLPKYQSAHGTPKQALTAGRTPSVDTSTVIYADVPVFTPTFTVKRRKPRSKPSPVFPKHAWSVDNG